jgi:glyoxylase-like metal-dependent hydrolase (beta-lactamase superfamily II)
MVNAIAWRAAGAAAAVLGLASCATLTTDPVEAALRRAEQAMGSATLQGVRYTAEGRAASVGQAFEPGASWPRLRVSAFTRTLDYAAGAVRDDYAVSRTEPTGGGVVPPMGQGEQRVIGLLLGQQAWSLSGPAAVPQPLAADARYHDLWTSPHGVLKAALRNKAAATLAVQNGKTLVSFVEPGQFRATVWLDAAYRVERVDSVLPHPVMGDMPALALYSNYGEQGGVQFPRRIQQYLGGGEAWNLEVRTVEAVPGGALTTPAPAVPPERVDSQKVADGVWFLAGGSHNSVLVELADHLLLVESPLNDARALAVIAEARKLAPGKPLRHVVNSHHHFDHAGGLRAAVAEGAALVVSERARPWFERILATPATVRPDALARSGRRAEVIGVNVQRSLGDARRPVEVLTIEESQHADGFLLVWLPRERLLVQADAFTPGTVRPGAPNPSHVNLLENIERLKLDVDRILPLHGRVVPMSELRAAAAGGR